MKNLKQIARRIKIEAAKSDKSYEKDFEKMFEPSEPTPISKEEKKEIEELYDQKPKDYKENIMELAHPTSVVVMDAYDKLNGLVENNIERQRIMLNIFNKHPRTGTEIGFKYAEARKSLLLSLIRTSQQINRLDNPQLSKLAQAPISQLSVKPMTKVAIAPLAIAGVVAAAVIIGGLYYQQHSEMASKGFERNCKQLINEIQDLINKDGSWSTNKYKEQFITDMTVFKANIEQLMTAYSHFKAQVDAIQRPTDAQQLIQIATEKPEESQALNKAYASFRAGVKNIEPILNQVEINFKSEDYKNSQVEEEGFLAGIGDKLNVGGLLHGGKGLVADDFDDVLRALPAFRKSVKDILDLLVDTASIANNAKLRIQDASYSSTSNFGEDKTKEMANKEKALNEEVSKQTQNQKDILNTYLGQPTQK